MAYVTTDGVRLHMTFFHKVIHTFQRDRHWRKKLGVRLVAPRILFLMADDGNLRFPIQLNQSDGKVLVIDLARLDEAVEVNAFLDKHFVSTTPIRQLSSFGREQDEIKKAQLELDWIIECLSHSNSLVIRDLTQGEDGPLVAVQINKIEGKTSQALQEEEAHPRLIRALFEELNREVDLFSRYETDRIFHLCMVAVSDQYGRRGLATKLNELAVRLAVQCGAGAIKAEAVSEYPARSAIKQGFDLIKSIDYATFVYDGLTPLASVQELVQQHPTVRLMARRLP